MIRLKKLKILERKSDLLSLPKGKLLINTINSHSYNTARRDKLFAESLTHGDVLIPDGISVVLANKFIGAVSKPKERIAGWDLFEFEMNQLSKTGGTVMFMGSSEKVLEMIRNKIKIEFPNLSVATYSPPYKACFTSEDDRNIIEAINNANPDLLWIGMTAPKQEKWAYSHWQDLNIHCHCGTIGAVFDFYAGTLKRAPEKWQKYGMEWLYRFIREPRRMWRRYLVGNVLFLWNIMVHEVFSTDKSKEDRSQLHSLEPKV